MRLSRLHVKNFRALKDCQLDLGSFVCVVGANNAGKSTILQALRRFIDGKKVDVSDLHDPGQPVEIHVTLTDFTDDDWRLIPDEEARGRTRGMLREGRIELVRRITPEESTLLYVAQRPRNPNYRLETLENEAKSKKGVEFVETVRTLAPGIAEQCPDVTRATLEPAFRTYCETLSADELESYLAPIKSGIPASIAGLMPEVIFVPAIKDVRDELKAKEATTFGKILALMTGSLERALGDDANMFERVQRLFGPAQFPDGTPNNDRLKQLGDLEMSIGRHLQEHFSGSTVSFVVPTPEVKTVLSGASLLVNDGTVEGQVETMGDGLKRSVLFALFRSHAELSQMPEWRTERPVAKRFLLLFEEPELYLHPTLQRVLFDSLGAIAIDNQVVVTTHSPFFFGSGSTTNFVKLAKQHHGRSKPHSTCTAVNLIDDVADRKTFEFINFDNLNAAFFARRVVLCEGPSDLIVLRHVAPKFCKEWNFDRSGTMLVRVGGKGNFKRYRDLFSRFGVDVFIVGDLDVLLQGLKQFELEDGPLAAMHSKLMEAVNAHVTAGMSPSRRTAEKTLTSNKYTVAWQRFRRGLEGFVSDCLSKSEAQELIAHMDLIEKDGARRAALQRIELRAQLQAVLARLRENHQVCLWRKGSIEDHYPTELSSIGDKVVRAETFVERDYRIDELRCDPDSGDGRSEYEVILATVFGEAPGTCASLATTDRLSAMQVRNDSVSECDCD